MYRFGGSLSGIWHAAKNHGQALAAPGRTIGDGSVKSAVSLGMRRPLLHV